MGKGLIPADNETWKVRRRAIVPAFHQKWLEHMIGWVRPGRQAGRERWIEIGYGMARNTED